MKNVLLLVNHSAPPYGDFSGMFQSITKTSGQFTVEVTSDRNSLCNLDAYDAVALYILGGEMTPEQEHGITSFACNGGGVLGVHGANAFLTQYEAYTEMIGTEFLGHDPLGAFDVHSTDDVDDILPRLEPQFRVMDECYNMKIHTDAPLRWFQKGLWRFEEKPLGYVRDYGEGRVFYTGLGHDHRTFKNPAFQDLLIKGLRYVCGMKDRNTVRFGIVGYGPLFNMGKHHSEQIARTYGFELTAVCDRDPARLEAAKEEQGDHIATFKDTNQLIKSGLIDLAIVIVPHVLHAEVARPFLEAGLNVITEKPFTVRVSDADDLIALAQKKEVVLWCTRSATFRPFRAPICRVGRIQDCKDEKGRLVCMRTPKKKVVLWCRRNAPFRPLRTPIWTERARAGRRGAGAGHVCSTSPRPLSSRFLTTATNQEHSHVARPQAHHAGPPGGGGFPCLRQLPPPP